MDWARFQCRKEKGTVERPKFLKESGEIWGVNHVGEDFLDVCDCKKNPKLLINKLIVLMKISNIGTYK